MSALPLGAGVRRKDDRRWADLGCVVAALGRGEVRVRFESGATDDLHQSDLAFVACRFEIAAHWRDGRRDKGLKP